MQHTVALTVDEVITWGCNEEGQCGQGERAEVATVKPRFIRMLTQCLVTNIVCGSNHTLCVTATSQVINLLESTLYFTSHLVTVLAFNISVSFK